MNQPLIITFVGNDRPGLVQDLAAVVEQYHASLADSRMTQLAGHFAGVALVHCSAEHAQALADALAALSERGITVAVTREAPGTEKPPIKTKPTTRLKLVFIGLDRSGLVRHVSAALSQRGINIDQLSSAVTSAPMTGEPLFTLDATVSLPPGSNTDDLRDSLEAIATDLDLDFTLGPIANEK